MSIITADEARGLGVDPDTLERLDADIRKEAEKGGTSIVEKGELTNGVWDTLFDAGYFLGFSPGDKPETTISWSE